MDKREKTIKGLEYLANWLHGKFEQTGEGDYELDAQTAEDAIALLKDQAPVEPKKKSFLISGVDEYYTSSLITVCGACENWLNTAAPRPKYCPNCGKAVMWND